MSWEKEIRGYKARMRAIKATVKVYLRAGRGFEDPELEEMEDLNRQEREEIMALYSKPKKGWDNDDDEF